MAAERESDPGRLVLPESLSLWNAFITHSKKTEISLYEAVLQIRSARFSKTFDGHVKEIHGLYYAPVTRSRS